MGVIMKKVNILEFCNLLNVDVIQIDRVKQYFNIDDRNERKHEIDGLNKLCEFLKNITYEHHIFENYYINYKIPQIGKEFDLLRIGENSVVNIELKSQENEDKILKQLKRNYYYISFLQKEIHCFTFVSENKRFYYYNNNKLEVATAENIMETIKQIKDIECDIDGLFVPNNYLVSPFNDTERFLKDEYFLTEQQEKIKNEILITIKNNNSKIFSIAGKAGTGKTLLTYDIAKTLIKQQYKVIIIHCASSNAGIEQLKQNKWDITTIKSFQTKQHDADILIFDESQRLSVTQVKNSMDNNKILLFSHDINQKLNRTNEAEKVVRLIEEKSSYSYELTDKIRTNKEIASFIGKFFDLSTINRDKMSRDDYKHVSLYYAKDNLDACQYIKYIQTKNWEYIYLTSSISNTSDKLRNVTFSSTQSAHKVIGQEFDNVAVVVTQDFYYNGNKKLSYKDKNYHYNPLETLFQAVTRTRNKLKIVIIDNPVVYMHCLNIILKNTDEQFR